MSCPNCKRPVKDGEANYPFCSERCKLIDLGAWSSERYVISTAVATEEAAGAGEEDGA